MNILDFFKIAMRLNHSSMNVLFVERSTGQQRQMEITLDPRKVAEAHRPKNPGANTARDEKHNLLTVYEVGIGWKSIPMDAILTVQ